MDDKASYPYLKLGYLQIHTVTGIQIAWMVLNHSFIHSYIFSL